MSPVKEKKKKEIEDKYFIELYLHARKNIALPIRQINGRITILCRTRTLLTEGDFGSERCSTWQEPPKPRQGKSN